MAKGLRSSAAQKQAPIVYNDMRIGAADLLGAPVGHPFKLLLVLQDPDDDGGGNRAAEVGGNNGVQAFVSGDVVLKLNSTGCLFSNPIITVWNLSFVCILKL